MNSPQQLPVTVQPYPTTAWQVSQPPNLPPGHVLVTAFTPFGPHMYVLDRAAASAVSKALIAPRIQVPQI